jgi:hypothetical protein
MWRNNKYIRIRRIPRDDFRYALLKNMSKIKQVPNDTYGHPKRGCVWFKRTNGNYTVITVRYTYLRLQPGVPSVPHYVWQMHHDKNCTTVIV